MATGSLLHDTLLAHLHAMSRQPFKDELVKLLGIKRDPERLAEWANKNPDRHAQAVAIFSRLAGYSERIEVEQTGLLGLAVKIQALSDAELEQLHAQRQRAKTQLPKVLQLPKVERTTSEDRRQALANDGNAQGD